ncbi:MAG TPA: hypothetical protein VEV38_03595 [Candidatus Eremiobacteraceae bacterium]|nr:hypothetical protein [Candidatus Eremiobacteraceae bacterium]
MNKSHWRRVVATIGLTGTLLLAAVAAANSHGFVYQPQAAPQSPMPTFTVMPTLPIASPSASPSPSPTGSAKASPKPSASPHKSPTPSPSPTI